MKIGFGKGLIIGIGVAVVGYLVKKAYDKYRKENKTDNEELEEVSEEFKRKSNKETENDILENDESMDPVKLKEMEEKELDKSLRAYLDEKNNNYDRPPKIISAEESDKLPSFIDQQVLYLYLYDYTIVDEEDNEIDDPERLIGDCLDECNFYDDNEKRIVFIMNYSLDTCYEVQKVFGSWENNSEGE